jgi:hypothetical protein
MDDTDRLIAAFFAATMTAKQTTPTLTDFFAHYDACMAGIAGRERHAAEQEERKMMEEHSKLWDEAPIKKMEV